jgi:hypothetical protein
MRRGTGRVASAAAGEAGRAERGEFAEPSQRPALVAEFQQFRVLGC